MFGRRSVGQVGLGVGAWPRNQAIRDLTQECRKNI